MWPGWEPRWSSSAAQHRECGFSLRRPTRPWKTPPFIPTSSFLHSMGAVLESQQPFLVSSPETERTVGAFSGEQTAVFISAVRAAERWLRKDQQSTGSREKKRIYTLYCIVYQSLKPPFFFGLFFLHCPRMELFAERTQLSILYVYVQSQAFAQKKRKKKKTPLP